jgi:DNA-binding HxlR family transcriptional regulator
MRNTSLSAMACPAARALDVVGEWWTLLIIRDALRGARRFEQFKQTGISDNILSARLRRLVEAGIFERSRYQQRPERHEYLLTTKGRALGPVVAALREWGTAWTEGPDRTKIAHCPCGHPVSVQLYCPHCNRQVTGAEIGPARDRG